MSYTYPWWPECTTHTWEGTLPCTTAGVRHTALRLARFTLVSRGAAAACTAALLGVGPGTGLDKRVGTRSDLTAGGGAALHTALLQAAPLTPLAPAPASVAVRCHLELSTAADWLPTSKKEARGHRASMEPDRGWDGREVRRANSASTSHTQTRSREAEKSSRLPTVVSAETADLWGADSLASSVNDSALYTRMQPSWLPVTNRAGESTHARAITCEYPNTVAHVNIARRKVKTKIVRTP